MLFQSIYVLSFLLVLLFFVVVVLFFSGRLLSNQKPKSKKVNQVRGNPKREEYGQHTILFSSFLSCKVGDGGINSIGKSRANANEGVGLFLVRLLDCVALVLFFRVGIITVFTEYNGKKPERQE